LTVVLSEGGELLAVAPLCVETKRVNGVLEQVVSFVGSSNHASDYCDFIAADSCKDALPLLVSAVRDALRDYSMIDLQNIPGTSPTLAVLEQLLPDAGYFASRGVQAEAPALMLRPLRSGHASLLNKTLTRHQNYFKKNGGLSLVRLDECMAIEKELPSFFEQHVRRRSTTAEPSQFLNPREREFYTNLTREFAGRGLHFSMLLSAERRLAYHFGFEHRGTLVWYKPSFDPQWSTRCPGELHLRLLIAECVARELEEFDFSVGEESYKYRLANVVRINERFRGFRRRSSYLLHSGRRLLARSAAIQATLQLGRRMVARG
jgi:CelD/BcsL family acetyltransferase involved in cellulose biosynthesis